MYGVDLAGWTQADLQWVVASVHVHVGWMEPGRGFANLGRHSCAIRPETAVSGLQPQLQYTECRNPSVREAPESTLIISC